jgi:hypothetical protein
MRLARRFSFFLLFTRLRILVIPHPVLLVYPYVCLCSSFSVFECPTE